MSHPHVVIVGGGVIGITSAVCLLKKYPSCRVSIYSESFTPHTTADGSAGLWEPFECPGTSEEDIIRWSKATWHLFLSWWQAGHKGVQMVPVKNYSTEIEPVPFWKDIPWKFQELTTEELKSTSKGEFKSGFGFLTLIAEPKQFLKLMMNELRTLGVSFHHAKISSLSDLAETGDILINCTGIGAFNITPDRTVFPIRGQIFMVEAPWIKETMLFVKDNKPTYLVVNENALIVGGTTQRGNWNTNLCVEDSKDIWKRATEEVPSLKNAKILGQWAGLRPGREDGVRLELERIDVNGRLVPVIHNYGHGGSGVTLCWGCAQDVTDLVIEEFSNLKFKSKF